MIKIIGNRGSGKTTALLSIAQQYGLTVVEPNIRAADFVKRTAKEKGFNMVNIISAHELLYDRIGNKQQYLIDELDWFLETIGVCGYSNTER